MTLRLANTTQAAEPTPNYPETREGESRNDSYGYSTPSYSYSYISPSPRNELSEWTETFLGMVHFVLLLVLVIFIWQAAMLLRKVKNIVTKVAKEFSLDETEEEGN